jgi:hypothetical protein
MTKEAFLREYRVELLARYPWAANTEKLDKYLSSVSDTISGVRTSWNHDGEAVTHTWRHLGGKGKPTLKALRSLPPA